MLMKHELRLRQGIDMHSFASHCLRTLIHGLEPSVINCISNELFAMLVLPVSCRTT